MAENCLMEDFIPENLWAELNTSWHTRAGTFSSGKDNKIKDSIYQMSSTGI